MKNRAIRRKGLPGGRMTALGCSFTGDCTPCLYWYGPLKKGACLDLIKKLNMFNFLHDNSEMKYLGWENQGSSYLVLTLPVKKTLVEIPVIEMTLR